MAAWHLTSRLSRDFVIFDSTTKTVAKVKKYFYKQQQQQSSIISVRSIFFSLPLFAYAQLVLHKYLAANPCVRCVSRAGMTRWAFPTVALPAWDRSFVAGWLAVVGVGLIMRWNRQWLTFDTFFSCSFPFLRLATKTLTYPLQLKDKVHR